MVEWKKIGDVCDVFAGGDLPSTYIKGNMPSEECIFPIYSNGVEEKSLYGFSDSYRVDKASITISARGTIGYHCIRKPYFTPIVRLITLIPKNIKNLNLSYLNEVLFNSNIDGTKGGIPQLTVPTVSRLLIPIPSIHEQERIVGILDTFTATIDNLKEQIAQRRKQYEYYRDQLLDLEGKPGVEMKTLGEMTKVLRGKRLTKNMLDEEAPYPVFHGGIEPLGFYSQYNREANTVMIINVGASAGTVGYCDRKFWSSDGCFCISQSDSINNKFLYYYLETKTHYLQSQVRHAGIPTLDNPVVEKIYVPLLTLSEQQRIVSILDTFEASIQNLEAQLSQREKQYEYYRNKLLTFE